MKKEGIDAYMVPSGDDHASEYVNDHFKCREYVSGFTGSAGTLLVTEEEAMLWTDGRYFLQAERQLDGSGISLMKAGQPGVPSIAAYLGGLGSKKKITLGFDGRTLNLMTGNILKNVLAKTGSKVRSDLDLVDRIFENRPRIIPSKLRKLPPEVTGKTFEEKRKEILNEMKKENADFLLLSDLTETAWLFNLRGSDVECTPVFFSFALISEKETILYVMDPEDAKSVLAKDSGAEKEYPGVTVRTYGDIYSDVKKLPEGCTVWIDPASINFGLAACLPENLRKKEAMTPVSMMKAVKNEEEIKSTLNAHKKDGNAMVSFIYWLKKNSGRMPMTEMSAAEWLDEKRHEKGAYDLSFATISGYGPNGAVIHYQASEETDARIRPEGFLLVDSGGQYRDGTTDITRTIALGPLSRKMKECYTCVLKSHIALASAEFSPGTTGRELDEIARRPLKEHGLDFNHGTGHGIGHMLSVHEGPNIISRRNADCRFVPGMITSDEPGVYIENEFGIRLENEILCVEKDGKYAFRPITYCPFDREAIIPELLTEKELDWLNSYHRMVKDTLLKDLPEEEAEWLSRAAAPISRNGE